MEVCDETDTSSLISQYNLDLDPELEAQIGTHARKPWANFVTSGRSKLSSLSSERVAVFQAQHSVM